MSEENNRSDEELVSLLKKAFDGDTRGFETLVSRHQNRVVANCRFLTRSPDDAEDLAQEVFVKAFFGLRRFEGRSLFKTWLERIKINHCLNYLEKKRRRTILALEETEPSQHENLRVEETAHKKLQAQSDRDRIGAILDQLSDKLRLPLVMRDLDGFSYEEIAERLGIGLSAVKMRIKRGREEFRRMWKETSKEEGQVS